MTLDEPFLARWVAWIREQEPGTVAVLLAGSYARGDAGPHSDLDLYVLTRDPPQASYWRLLTELPDGRLLHISISADECEEWLAARAEAADWSFGFLTREEARLLWVEESFREQLGDPTVVGPPAGFELGDFLEYLCKVKNARRRGDELALRFAAQDLAQSCPGILRPMNPEQRVGTPYEALRAALDLPIAPPRYREDLLVCLGLSGRATDAEEIYERATRLAGGVIDMVRSHLALVAAQMEPELPRYLTDGTLARYLAQEDDPR